MFWAVLLLLVVIYVIKGVIIVQQAEAVIVERLGKFEKELGPGLEILAPRCQRQRLFLY